MKFAPKAWESVRDTMNEAAVLFVGSQRDIEHDGIAEAAVVDVDLEDARALFSEDHVCLLPKRQLNLFLIGRMTPSAGGGLGCVGSFGGSHGERRRISCNRHSE